MRHTHREIQEAKMLGRRLAASENVSSPPLSRLKNATRFVFAAARLALRMKAAAFWRYVRDKSVCPCCQGHKQQLTHVYQDEFELRACRLCKGSGEVTWREVESYKWGGALLEYRLSRGISLAQMYYAVGLTPGEVQQLEYGIVPLDDWPDTARNLAESVLSRTN